MIYVMSDIHGEYEKYKKMLELINFSDDDELFITGDIIDRGPHPILLLRDMAVSCNVHAILGDHEVIALDILKTLFVEITEQNYATQITPEVLEKLMFWQQNGGNTTLDEFKKLSTDERYDVIDFLEELPPLDAVTVNGRYFILCHGGLGNFDRDKKLSQYTLNELAFMRSTEGYDFKKENVFVVSGHTPTISMSDNADIILNENHFNIDCGATFSEGRLACIRLDDLQYFYVD